MQTNLRKVIWLFVVSLLWTSLTSAAIVNAKARNAHPVPTPRYVGVASWYGANRQGRKMANGKRFDRRALTAASWYFPLGTVIRVVNLNNGSGVTVTVTDRGPNLRLRRVVDLSEAAAEQLGYIGAGLTRVFVVPAALVTLEHADFDAELVEPFEERPLFAATASLAEAALDAPN